MFEWLTIQFVFRLVKLSTHPTNPALNESCVCWCIFYSWANLQMCPRYFFQANFNKLALLALIKPRHFFVQTTTSANTKTTRVAANPCNKPTAAWVISNPFADPPDQNTRDVFPDWISRDNGSSLDELFRAWCSMCPSDVPIWISNPKHCKRVTL